MWTYKQSTGVLYHDGLPIATGYAGHGEGRNNPTMQNVPNIGPLPRGLYTIGSPMMDGKHGPYYMHLTPDPSNEMFDRGGFLMHGDSIEHPGCASEGCICQARSTREAVHNSDDNRLEVVE